MALVTGLHCPGIPGVPAIFAEKGSYASGAYIGEERCQHLTSCHFGNLTTMAQIGVPTFFPPKSPLSLEKMGLLPSACSLLWGSAFGATAHNDVHDAAHDAFMTLPHHTRTREGEVQLA